MTDCSTSPGLVAWLDCHGRAVSALGSFVVAGITAVYVGLTWKIMRTNVRALNELERERKVRRDQAIALAARLGDSLEKLPAEPPWDDPLRAAAWWDDDEPEELRKLVVEFAPAAEATVREVEHGLRWLHGLADRVRATPALAGYHYSQHEKDEWVAQFAKATTGLKAIRGALKQ